MGIMFALLTGPVGVVAILSPLAYCFAGLTYIFSYLLARVSMLENGKPLTIGWTIGTLILLFICLAPGLFFLAFAMIFWFALLPALGIYLLVLIVKLARLK